MYACVYIHSISVCENVHPHVHVSFPMCVYVCVNDSFASVTSVNLI